MSGEFAHTPLSARKLDNCHSSINQHIDARYETCRKDYCKARVSVLKTPFDSKVRSLRYAR